jgi:hypothetical protein
MPDDPRHPHLGKGYAWEGGADMAARPQSVNPATHTMTSAGGAAEVTMLPGRALEEMGIDELRKRAKARGIPYSGLKKAALVKALRD